MTNKFSVIYILYSNTSLLNLYQNAARHSMRCHLGNFFLAKGYLLEVLKTHCKTIGIRP